LLAGNVREDAREVPPYTSLAAAGTSR
jgi:hypothetical protein